MEDKERQWKKVELRRVSEDEERVKREKGEEKVMNMEQKESQ